MLAKEALEDITQSRHQSQAPQPQLDWRWVERFREHESYDSYWWLTWAGPFTAEEQQQWDELFALPFDEAIKTQLERLMTRSRECELTEAIAEQREPYLHYPAIEIEEIRRRTASQRQLDADKHNNKMHPGYSHANARRNKHVFIRISDRVCNGRIFSSTPATESTAHYR